MMTLYAPANAQVINGYAKVTSISGTVLSVSNVNEGGDSFEDDEWVVLIQMQDNVIGTTTNSATFGSLGAIGSVGTYEIRQIDSHTETAGSPTTITLKNAPVNSYSTGANSSLQIVTFREYGSPDYTTTSNMSALAWDGNVGGVVAFFVDGVLTLAHDIDADGDGFNGGGFNGGGSTGCTGGSNYRVSTNNNHADKGEGIYKATNANYAAGRARILTGGGGGNSHNAGGGGGGNYTGGGTGGPGWPTCTPTAGGIGGLDMSATIHVSRVFMGGGGGAGEGNNGWATPGADGGGIVIIKANEITTGTCGGGVSITANASSVTGTSGNDGAGGGGGGGSIILDVDTWNVSAACPLSVSSNGGNGGSVNSGATHGGGGGGGQGAVFYSTAVPTTNITTETLNGDGGCNNSSVPCNSVAETGTGTDNAGVQSTFTEPLPVELLSFEVALIEKTVALNWITASERNNAEFIIERSADGLTWEPIRSVEGAGNSTEELHYQEWDFNPLTGVSYYRLKQVDFDGTSSLSAPVSIYFSTGETLVYPNPAKNEITVAHPNITDYDIVVVDALGRIVSKMPATSVTGQINFDISDLPVGVYTIQLLNQGKTESHRFVKTK